MLGILSFKPAHTSETDRRLRSITGSDVHGYGTMLTFRVSMMSSLLKPCCPQIANLSIITVETYFILRGGARQTGALEFLASKILNEVIVMYDILFRLDRLSFFFFCSHERLRNQE